MVFAGTTPVPASEIPQSISPKYFRSHVKASIVLRRNKDGTATFRYGRYVESFDVEGKGLYETYEAIKWIAITAGIELSDGVLEEFFREARGLVD